MDLRQGEHVIYEGHPSWRAVLGFYILGILAVVVAGAIAAGVSQVVEDEVKPGWIAAAAGAVALIVLIAGWLKRIATSYTITSQRLRIRRGILSKNVEETRVDRIQDVSTQQSFLERILRVGTVDFDTSSVDADEAFRFRGVSNPAAVVRAVDEASHQARTAQQGGPAA
jgi:uncharacterized membrane protein YdbT with pleckstrin-like domain